MHVRFLGRPAGHTVGSWAAPNLWRRTDADSQRASPRCRPPAGRGGGFAQAVSAGRLGGEAVPRALACPACRTGMLTRRGDPLCPTCIKAAREMPWQPLWLFDSQLLRQALAQMNLSAVSAIVRAAS